MIAKMTVVNWNCLATATLPRRAHHVGAVKSADGPMASVVFTDSGPGIPADIRAKIFAPFFTTKSRGSGLGLPTAKRLIEAHRGQIHLTCPERGGTSVTIQLPA